MSQHKNIAGIILAAGQSRRMETGNKVLKLIDRQAMLLHVIDAANNAHLHPIIVVTGHEHEKVQHLLKNSAVDGVFNPDYRDGIASSIAHGIRQLGQTVDAAIILLGDMPHIKATHLNKLINAYNPLTNTHICVPYCQGQRGNPLLWGKKHFFELQQLQGDRGARVLLEKYRKQTSKVTINDAAIFLDIDTPVDLENINQQDIR